MTSPTPNKGYTYPAHGGAVDAWDTPLNANFDQIDLNVGGYYPITISSTVSTVTFNSSYAIASSTAATLTPNSSIAQNLFYRISGTLTRNVKLVIPSAGGFYQIDNATSGSFDLTVGTAGGTAATVAQGGTNMVVCDGTDTDLSNSNPTAAKVQTYLGSPNGSVAGTVGATNGAFTDVLWDATNRQLYVPSTSGTALTTVWSPQLASPTPGGILTVRNSTTSPRVVSDTTSTTVYYTPLVSNWTILSTGTILFPYQFSRLTLTLTATQAASQIYDVFMWWNGGTPVIGTGPSWTAGASAGSVSPGSCARGSGVGSTALTRLQGILVNNVAVTLTNGATTYACPASEGIYLGSIFIDTSAGNVTCHTSYGQTRKWGVWNYYNRALITLRMGDATTEWTPSGATIRQSNSSTSNTAAVFTGMDEEWVNAIFDQNCKNASTYGNALQYGIGLNSATAFSGMASYTTASSGGDGYAHATSTISIVPFTGINNLNTLEHQLAGSNSAVRSYGGNENMVLTIYYMG